LVQDVFTDGGGDFQVTTADAQAHIQTPCKGKRVCAWHGLVRWRASCGVVVEWVTIDPVYRLPRLNQGGWIVVGRADRGAAAPRRRATCGSSCPGRPGARLRSLCSRWCCLW